VGHYFYVFFKNNFEKDFIDFLYGLYYKKIKFEKICGGIYDCRGN